MYRSDVRNSNTNKNSLFILTYQNKNKNKNSLFSDFHITIFVFSSSLLNTISHTIKNNFNNFE